jgi:hypothetical protein
MNLAFGTSRHLRAMSISGRSRHYAGVSLLLPSIPVAQSQTRPRRLMNKILQFRGKRAVLLGRMRMS